MAAEEKEKAKLEPLVGSGPMRPQERQPPLALYLESESSQQSDISASEEEEYEKDTEQPTPEELKRAGRFEKY